MRRALFIVLIVLVGCLASFFAGARIDAQEKVSLTVPVFQSTGITDFRVESLYLHRTHPDSLAEIRAIFREVDAAAAFVPLGKTLTCRYAEATADALIASLNTTNLTTASLEKRVTQRCQADGKLGAGTISGTPQ